MTHRITVAGSDIAFPCDAGETILDAAERAGFAMPYSCRKGVCSSCKGGIVAGYNKLLGAQKAAFAQAYAAEGKRFGKGTALDSHVTGIYNYFAQPPVQASFCATAEAVLSEAAALPADAFPQFAAQALPRLDRPFTEFYAAYDRYRSDLAAWQAGSQQPRLNYDPAVFAASEQVTGRDVTGVASR